MSCDFVQAQLQAYLDEQLDDGALERVELHLAGCSSCQQELLLLRQVDEALHTFPVCAEPADFTARVITQIQAEEPVSVWQQWRQELAGLWRWEDILVSGALASSLTAAGLTPFLLQPQLDSLFQHLLQQTNSTLVLESEQLWRIFQADPRLLLWGLTMLGAAGALGLTAGMLTQQWSKFRRIRQRK